MTLKIKAIHAAGDLEHERVVLQATADTDVGQYCIFVSGKGPHENAVRGGNIPHCYWIPDRKVKNGDLVVVYTKEANLPARSTLQDQLRISFIGLTKTTMVRR